MRLSFFCIAVFFALFLFSSESSALSCSVIDETSPNPLCSGTVVFRMLSTSNSHAGLFTAITYPYAVCCTDPTRVLSVMKWNTLSESACNPLSSGRVISLNGIINSHAERYEYSNYDNNICLSADYGNLSCTYRTSCIGGETCLASIAANTESHVGDCSAYSQKICCTVFEGQSIVGPDSDISVRVGEQTTILISLSNQLSIPDTFTLDLQGTPEKIGAWMWFNGHRYDEEKMKTSIVVPAGKSMNAAIIVFGGEANINGELYVNVKSASTGAATQIRKTVSVVYGSEGSYFQTPEFGWIGYIVIGILAALLI